MNIFHDFKARRGLEELQEEFLKLKRDVQAVKLEWQDTYDRILKLTQRMAKRAEIAEKLAESSQGESPGVSAVDDGTGAEPSSTTERHRRLNAEIARRRAMRIERPQ